MLIFAFGSSVLRARACMAKLAARSRSTTAVDKALKKAQKSLNKKAGTQKKKLEDEAVDKKKAIEDLQWKHRAALRDEMGARIAFLGLGETKADKSSKGQQHAHWGRILSALPLPAKLDMYLRVALAKNPLLWRNVVEAMADARANGMAFTPLMREAPPEKRVLQPPKGPTATALSPFLLFFGAATLFCLCGVLSAAIALGPVQQRVGTWACAALLSVSFASAGAGFVLGALLFVP